MIALSELKAVVNTVLKRRRFSCARTVEFNEIIIFMPITRTAAFLLKRLQEKIAGDRLVILRVQEAIPLRRVHPLTLKHLQQRNYSIEGLTSQSWDDLKNFEPDIIVITVCDSAAN